MSDIKSVIALLCKHLHLTIGSPIKPEHVRQAKYNKNSQDIIQIFWRILRILGRIAAEELHETFDDYDDVNATKLYFAYLNYPVVEFYGFSQSDDNSIGSELLISLSWLIAKKNVFATAIRHRIANSPLGHEFSSIDVERFSENAEGSTSSRNSRSDIRRIVDKSETIVKNVQEIGQLMNEKMQLVVKIHKATSSKSDFSHPSISELGLAIKARCRNRDPEFTKKSEGTIEASNYAARCLEIHDRWIEKEHIFFDWMATVIEENERNDRRTINRSAELSKFVSLLRHVTKKKMRSLENEKFLSSNGIRAFSGSCVSRFLRVSENVQLGDSSLEMAKTLRLIDAEVAESKEKVLVELEKMLKDIPNCV